jgi:hypothetical protein
MRDVLFFLAAMIVIAGLSGTITARVIDKQRHLQIERNQIFESE